MWKSSYSKNIFSNETVKERKTPTQIKGDMNCGGARGVMVIVARCGHDNMSSNPGRAWLHFT